MGVQSTPDHDEQELEITGLVLDEAAPIENPGDSAQTSDHQQTQEGLARLFDFLQAKKAQKEAEKQRSRTIQDVAFSAYNRVQNGNPEVRGTNLKIRV